MDFSEAIWRINMPDVDESYIEGEASGIIFGIQVDGVNMTARLARDGVVTGAGGAFVDQIGNRVHSIADVDAAIDFSNGEVKGKTYIVSDRKWLEENGLVSISKTQRVLPTYS